jgi:L-serine dehydratase
MRGGFDFYENISRLPADVLARAKHIKITLYGSLSATGKGHGTDRAIIAGLMGYSSEKCPPCFLNDLDLSKPQKITLSPTIALTVGEADIVWGDIGARDGFANTFVVELLSDKDEVLFSRDYYSVGGGFLQWKGWKPEKRGAPVHEYSNMSDFVNIVKTKKLNLEQVMMENEMAITGLTSAQINEKLDFIIGIMKSTVQHGLSVEGRLPGPIGLMRKAKVIYESSKDLPDFEKQICLLNAYAYAVSEENATGNTVVTAPTCGSSGVIPSLINYIDSHLHLSIEEQRRGLLAAVVIGFIAKSNAAIAGAEVGCQGEVGVATAMGAALIACIKGAGIDAISSAAEIGLEHQLGLTCDPIGGYVQIPCIERNAIAAVKAYDSAIIASYEHGYNRMKFDDTLKAMKETGRDMNIKYKETSMGGLAVVSDETQC